MALEEQHPKLASGLRIHSYTQTYPHEYILHMSIERNFKFLKSSMIPVLFHVFNSLVSTSDHTAAIKRTKSIKSKI